MSSRDIHDKDFAEPLIASADGMEADLRAPDRLTLRARCVTRMVRWGVRLWPREDPGKLARRARRVFELPNALGLVCSRGIRIQPVDDGGVCGEWLGAPGREESDYVLLYIHGGGYVSCSARSHRSITATLAKHLPGRVFSLDYRLAPEFPFPAAVDDAAAAYEWLLERGFQPERIAIGGDSAGGGLALATLLRVRKSGQPLPACAICLSPWVDLTGECNYQNAGTGSIFQAQDIAGLAKLYLRDAPPIDPEASPVFADLKGLPALLIHAARSELLADEAARLHARARECGVKSTLVLYPDLPHVWQIYGSTLPEARLALQQAAAFVGRSWKVS